MKRLLLAILILFILLAADCARSAGVKEPGTSALPVAVSVRKLPEPRLESDYSLEQALLNRRSIREYTPGPISLDELSQLLWAAQGITTPDGRRTAPSAGALYPLEIYVVAGNVEDLPPGLYRYRPAGHELVSAGEKDRRNDLSQAALGQKPVREAAADIVITGVYERITPKYGDRGIRYTWIEAGHAAQNLCLQATALGLGTVTIGAFEDEKVKGVLDLPAGETPLYILPVGHKN